MPDIDAEPHPILHDFSVVNDEIVERTSRKVPALIRREERCDYCNTRRITRIDVLNWAIVGSRQYKYPPNHQIIRITKAAWLRQTFTETSTLDRKELAKL